MDLQGSASVWFRNPLYNIFDKMIIQAVKDFHELIAFQAALPLLVGSHGNI